MSFRSFIFAILLLSGSVLLESFAYAQLLRPAGPVDTDYADPSAPDLQTPGLIRIYLTAGEVLTWQNDSTKNVPDILKSTPPVHERLVLCHSDGSPLNDEAGEDAWDPTFRDGVLYAGAMTPPPNHKFARWPDDNWSRRTYAFISNGSCWVMQTQPLWGERPLKETWIGHNYGHEFLEDESGTTYVFYERVTDDSNGQPWKTELFARKMVSAFQASTEEISIYRISDPPWAATLRNSGGHLVEGARPFKALGKYFISFSAGEYTSAHYAIHLLWADHIEGPYLPYLNERGTNLKDFGQEVEVGNPMTWGAARAVFFEAGGQWWSLFHGIAVSENQDLQNGKRSVYLAPVTIEERPSGPPEIRIHHW